MLGGSLAHPAEKMPWLNFAFLRRYPFFLPGGVSSLLTVFAVFIGYFVLKEVSSRIQPLIYHVLIPLDFSQ